MCKEGAYWGKLLSKSFQFQQCLIKKEEAKVKVLQHIYMIRICGWSLCWNRVWNRTYPWNKRLGNIFITSHILSTILLIRVKRDFWFLVEFFVSEKRNVSRGGDRSSDLCG